MHESAGFWQSEVVYCMLFNRGWQSLSKFQVTQAFSTRMASTHYLPLSSMMVMMVMVAMVMGFKVDGDDDGHVGWILDGSLDECIPGWMVSAFL